jgi:hypothetical protein
MNDATKPKPRPRPQPESTPVRETAREALQQSLDRRW